MKAVIKRLDVDLIIDLRSVDCKWDKKKVYVDSRFTGPKSNPTPFFSPNPYSEHPLKIVGNVDVRHRTLGRLLTRRIRGSSEEMIELPFMSLSTEQDVIRQQASYHFNEALRSELKKVLGDCFAGP